MCCRRSGSHEYAVIVRAGRMMATCGRDLRELAQERRRFGYRRLHILLCRDGITINRKKTQRLYREE